MKWDAKARYGVFAGYNMTKATAWNKAYLVWDLMTFKGADLHVTTNWRQQYIGIPMIVRKCELPVEDGICFPLKAEYDRINGDLFDPAFQDHDPADGPRPAELLEARKPQQAALIKGLDPRYLDEEYRPPPLPPPAEEHEEDGGPGTATPRLEDTLREKEEAGTSKDHLDAIEFDLWADKDEGIAEGGVGTSSPAADPVSPDIACLPHVSEAKSKDFKVYRSDEGKRVTLDSSGVIRPCDSGGNILRKSSGKGVGDRPEDVHHSVWTSIKAEAKRRLVSVEVVLAEKRAERPGQALTVLPAGEASIALPAPSTLPHSYHPEYGVILPDKTKTRQILAVTIMENEMKTSGPESRELICH